MPTGNLYLQHRDLIERTIDQVCRRQALQPADAEDFASIVRIHLLDDDAAALRAFAGRSSLRTYLTVVVMRQFQDWRNARWGKFRSSVAARRRGDVAVKLERLTCRDGLSFDEAFETLRTHHAVTQPRSDLERWAAEFPARMKRRYVGDETLAEYPPSAQRPMRRCAMRKAPDAPRRPVRSWPARWPPSRPGTGSS